MADFHVASITVPETSAPQLSACSCGSGCSCGCQSGGSCQCGGNC